MAASFFFVCLSCLLFSVGGEEIVENVSASTGKVTCTAGEFQYTENKGMALLNITYPSRILLQTRELDSAEECTSLCCDFVGCNVASFVNIDDEVRVCDLVASEASSCFWQSFPGGVATFLDRKIPGVSDQEVPQTSTPPTSTTTTTTTTTTQAPTENTTTQEVATNDSEFPTDEAEDEDDSWWFNPFNWMRPDKDYPEDVITEEPEEKKIPPSGNATENPKGLLDAILNASKPTTDKPQIPAKPVVITTTTNSPVDQEVWDYEKMFGFPAEEDSFYESEDTPPPEDVFVNPLPPDVNNVLPNPVDGVKHEEMGSSWPGEEPKEMPAEDNTTYTVGLAVFLASLGLAGVLVITIQFVSKNKQKSKYSLLEVEEEESGDKQPFLPK